MSENHKKLPSQAVPKWETAIMAVSCLVLLAWSFVRNAAAKAHADLDPSWNWILGVALLALVFVFVRRLKRTVKGMTETGAFSKRGSGANRPR